MTLLYYFFKLQFMFEKGNYTKYFCMFNNFIFQLENHISLMI